MVSKVSVEHNRTFHQHTVKRIVRRVGWFRDKLDMFVRSQYARCPMQFLKFSVRIHRVANFKNILRGLLCFPATYAKSESSLDILWHADCALTQMRRTEVFRYVRVSKKFANV